MFLKTNTMEMMSVCGCCGNSCLMALGILSQMGNVFILRKEYLLHCGSSKGFGNKGILETKIDYVHRSYLESLSNF